MSVVLMLKFQGDVAAFRRAVVEHATAFTKIAEDARASGGGIHHRMAVGDGFVLVVDEWQSAGHFRKFSASPALQALIAASGAAPQPPEVTIAGAISTPGGYEGSGPAGSALPMRSRLGARSGPRP